MPVELDEPISVGAVFSHGEIRPVWFARGRRQVRINEIDLTWKTREGIACIHHFSVTDGKGMYEIVLNTATMLWRVINADS
jgi:hypothetical protein